MHVLGLIRFVLTQMGLRIRAQMGLGIKTKMGLEYYVHLILFVPGSGLSWFAGGRWSVLRVASGRDALAHRRGGVAIVAPWRIAPSLIGFLLLPNSL